MTSDQIEILEALEADPKTAMWAWFWDDNGLGPYSANPLDEYPAINNVPNSAQTYTAARLRVQAIEAIEAMKGLGWRHNTANEYDDAKWSCDAIRVSIYSGADGMFSLFVEGEFVGAFYSLAAAQLAAEPLQQQAVAMMRDVRG